MSQKTVLLIIGGGIAAYKSLLLIRKLQQRNISVRAILTRAGAQFVTPLSVSALTGEKCFTDLFDLTDEAEMGHIELSRAADLIVVAPATADLMAKMAHGLADDLASTCLLATDTDILVVPAMNVRMWHHAATQRNLAHLRQDGVRVVGPDEGEMACGEFGFGRMAEPDEIARAITNYFADTQRGGPLLGKHVLITAGPTHEPIDPVRYLANRSSGLQGYAIAAACAEAGAQVTLISGPTNLTVPEGVDMVRVQTAREMMRACEAALPATVGIFCAAVADYRPKQKAVEKIKKEKGGMGEIKLSENPDILKTIANHPDLRPELVIGFAAETEAIKSHAVTKKKRKNCDWIIANDVSSQSAIVGGVMGGMENQVIFIGGEQGDGKRDPKPESWPPMSKQQVAARLVQKIIDHFG